MTDHRPAQIPPEVLRAWGFEDADCTAIESGLINRTWRVRTPEADYALQWVNPIFGPECIRDLEKITRTLDEAGVLTPRLHPSLEGLSFFQCESGVWRCLTWIDGESLEVATDPAHCREAGRMLGVFHAVFWDSRIRLSDARSPVHDLSRHRRFLGEKLVEYRSHRNFCLIQGLAEQILQWPDPLPGWAQLPKRIVHGDPKISNFLFDASGRALSIVDFDTPCHAALADELGDALRSWCHPGAEDEIVDFSVERFEAAMEGWFEGIGDIRPEEAEIPAIIGGIERISLELAARFAADALGESYFGWDAIRYPSASEHNLARAKAQFSLTSSVAALKTLLGESLLKVMDRTRHQ